ncbi:hypothetical protein H0H87_001493 [Tephrocybe sp. NHM501043]|nr:hypothetical protein H0H87_001493 [Tephrocybe sp. NHM501043]
MNNPTTQGSDPLAQVPQAASTRRLEALRSQADALLEGQRYTNTLLNDLLEGAQPQNVVPPDLGDVLGIMESRLNSLLDNGRSYQDRPSRGSDRQHTQRSDAAHHRTQELEHTISENTLTAELASAQDYGRQDPLVIQRLHELLSDDELPLFTQTTLEYPPPIPNIRHYPHPRYASTSTLSEVEDFSHYTEFLLPAEGHSSPSPQVRSRHIPAHIRVVDPEHDPQDDGEESEPDGNHLAQNLRDRQMRRLLAVDSAFVSTPEDLSRSNTRHRHQSRTHHAREDNNRRPRAPFGDDREASGDRHAAYLPQPQNTPVGLPQHRPDRHHHREGDPQFEPTQPSSTTTWYARPAPDEAQRLQRDVIVQVSSEIFDPAMRLIQDVELTQQAMRYHQRDIVRYVNDLNTWMEQEVEGRRAEYERVDLKLATLTENVREATQPALDYLSLLVTDEGLAFLGREVDM